MTLNEFKAWLEGYEESFVEGEPNADQYARIKEKLAKVAAPASVSVRQTPPFIDTTIMPYTPPRWPNTSDWQPKFGEIICSNGLAS